MPLIVYGDRRTGTTLGARSLVSRHAATAALLLAGLVAGAVAEPNRLGSETQPAAVPECVRKLMDENTRLSAEHRQLTARIDGVAEKRKIITGAIARIETDLSTMREAVETPGMKAYIGPLLNEKKKQLPDIAGIQRDIQVIREEANAAHVQYLTLQDHLDDLADVEARVAELLSAAQVSAPGIDTTTITPAARTAFVSQAGEMESLRKDYVAYWRSLVALSVLNEQLLGETEAFRRFINERMLWLPSAQPLHMARFPNRLTPVPGVGRTLGEAVRRDIANQLGWYVLTAFFLAIWVVAYNKVRLADRRIHELVSHPYTDTFRLTIGALGIAVHRSLPVPALMWILGDRLASCVPATDAMVYEFAQSLAHGFYRSAVFLFFMSFLRRLCRPQGIAEAHFRWDVNAVRILRKNLAWMICVGVPVVFLINFTEFHPDPAWRDSIGRIAFILVMITLGVFSAQMFHPRRGLQAAQACDPHPQRRRSPRRMWYFLALGVPVALAITAATRYFLTAAELGRHLYRTIMLVLALMVARSLIVRFVLVSRQRLAIEQARQERSAEGGPGDSGPADKRAQAVLGPLVLGGSIDSQTETLLHWLVVLGLVFGVWPIWRDIIPAVSFMARIPLWSYGSEGGGAPSTVYLSSLITGLIVAMTTWVLARNGPDVIETALLARLPIDKAARFALVTIIRYIIVVAGVAITLGAIGIGWSRIHWLIAGISVGLGFGLQEIFANFVSGLIILFERPVRIGDVVTVGGVDGKITRIQVRATTVTDWTRRELIVPNKEFITGTIINWTLSDPVTRVDIPVGLAYGSNTRLARDLLLQVAGECPQVLDEPAPAALFKGFGESSLDFELQVCIPNRDVWAEMVHELHTRIDDEFRRAGIEIAFPQRDIHIRSIPEGLPAGACGRPSAPSAEPDQKIAEGNSPGSGK